MTWDYIAGFFDGEGHVGLHPDGTKRGRRSICLSVANTHLPTLRAIRAFLAKSGVPSSIYVRSPNGNRKPIGSLRVTEHTAQRAFLSEMAERGVTKAEQSAKVLAYISGREWLVPFSASTLNDALAAYKRGESLRDIEASHGVSSRTLRKHASRKGVVMRVRGEAVALAIKKRR